MFSDRSKAGNSRRNIWRVYFDPAALQRVRAISFANFVVNFASESACLVSVQHQARKVAQTDCNPFDNQSCWKVRVSMEDFVADVPRIFWRTFWRILQRIFNGFYDRFLCRFFGGFCLVQWNCQQIFLKIFPIKPHNPCSTKTMLSIAIALLGVVYVLLLF